MTNGCKSPYFLALAVLLILVGCAARGPLDLGAVDSSADPYQVRRDFEGYRGRTVQWGGLIVNRSEEGGTPQLEILSYPLHNDGNPDEYLQPAGLFVFRYTGEQDLSGHQSGRFVTVVGEITEMSGGEGGAKTQPLPLVKGDQIHLWGSRYRNDRSPRATFGFGLGMRF